MPVRQLPKQAFSLVAAASFISGALTIALEMILMRLATRYTGSASDGTTTALTIFLLGLLAGSAWVLRLNNKKGQNFPALTAGVLAALSLLAAGLAVISRLSLDQLPIQQWWGGQPLCAALIFIPAGLCGTIFPFMLAICARYYFGTRESFEAGGAEVDNFSNKAMLLYLASNLGSALGAMGSTIWLLPRLGIANSLNFIALSWFVLSLLLAPLVVASKTVKQTYTEEVKKNKDLEKETASEIQLAESKDAAKDTQFSKINEAEDVDLAGAVVASSTPLTFAAVCLASLLGLLFECISIRTMALLGGASFVTTSCVIAAILLGIVLGTRLALFLPQNKNTPMTLALALSFAALGMSAVLVLLPHLSSLFQGLRHITLGQAPPDDRHLHWLGYLYPRLVLSLIFCLPGAAGLSLIFPVTSRSASRPLDTLRLYIAGGLGTALAPIVFTTCMSLTLKAVPSTIEFMLRAMTALLLLFTFKAAANPRLFGKKTLEMIFSKLFCFTAAAAACLSLFLVRPANINKLDMGLTFVSPLLTVGEVEADEKQATRLYYKEGRTATVSVLERKQDNTISLRSDGKVEGTVPILSSTAAVASDLPTQSLLALLPMIWTVQTDQIKSCLLIGYGTGTTAATIVQASQADALTVAEIEPAVLEAGKYFKENSGIVPPKSLKKCDARHFLQDNVTTYDIVVSQPAEPWVQGSSNLYSSEFYQLVKNRLTGSGVFCQWLQLYGMDEHGLASALTTFHSVFPECLVFHPTGAGELIVLGFKSKKAPDIGMVRQNFLEPNRRRLLARAGIDNFAALQKGLWLDSQSVGEAAQEWREKGEGVIVTDDNLALELDTLPEIENAAGCIQKNLAMLNKWIKLTATRTSAPAESTPEAAIEASTQLDAGNREKAMQIADSCGALDPDSVSAINLQAAVALRLGNLPDAQTLIAKSLKLNPNDSTAHTLKSLANLFQGKASSAIDEAEIAHKLDHLDYQPYLLSAAAYHLSGDSSQALAMLRRTRQICPDGVILKQVENLAGEFSRQVSPMESSSYSGTLASRLTRLLRVFLSSSKTRCNNVI
jgi:spermidine synthase